MGRQDLILVVGGGIFGLTAAQELRRRGHPVTVIDPGPIPHPHASSTDISKIVRMDYGSDDLYLVMGEQARLGWQRWNENLFDEPLYHETGVLFLNSTPMSPHSYEYESYQRLQDRGYNPERLSDDGLVARFPAWRRGVYVDGYLNQRAGWVESGRVVAALADRVRELGARVVGGVRVARLDVREGRVAGVATSDGEILGATHVIVAAGAWTPGLVPELATVMRPIGQPVFHLRPADEGPFRAPRFLPFTADISHTGWYGFPLHPRAGVVKIANHGVGRSLDPDIQDRTVTVAEVQRLRAFLKESLPALAAAPIVETRVCFYCDTLDEHFWIDRHPTLAGLTVAAGGSGHAFKFAPLLGGLIADACEGTPSAEAARFRWRTLRRSTTGQEEARHRQEQAGRLAARGDVRERGDSRA